MTDSSKVEVTGPDGLRGTIDTARWPLDGSKERVEVVLADGRRLMVPRALLRSEGGRTYRLPLAADQLTRHESVRDDATVTVQASTAIPVIEESLKVGKRAVETGRVRIRKVIREEEQTVDEPLTREEVTVERRAVERAVDGPEASRTEGDALIIPIVREVLVVEKRLMVTEELVVRKRVVEEHQPQTVTVRREEAVVERLAPQGAPPAETSGVVGGPPPGASAGDVGEMGKDGTRVANTDHVQR